MLEHLPCLVASMEARSQRTERRVLGRRQAPDHSQPSAESNDVVHDQRPFAYQPSVDVSAVATAQITQNGDGALVRADRMFPRYPAAIQHFAALRRTTEHSRLVSTDWGNPPAGDQPMNEEVRRAFRVKGGGIARWLRRRPWFELPRRTTPKGHRFVTQYLHLASKEVAVPSLRQEESRLSVVVLDDFARFFDDAGQRIPS